jgi:16S rRNA processing protein RimM
MSSRSSTTEASGTELPETVAVARIRSPHGVRGGVAVDVLTDVEGRLGVGRELLLVGPRGDRRRVRIRISKPYRTGRILAFDEFGSRDEAAELKGSVLEVPRDQVPPAEEGSWYQFELVGCACEDAAAGELGRVVEVIEDGGGQLLRVEDRERSLLVPFVEAFVTAVDVERRRIGLRLPEGLIEQCASRR